MIETAAALFTALAIFFVPGFADRFIYYPAPLPPAWSPEKAGLFGAELCSIGTSDGVRLSALFIGRDDARASVLYLHGNAGNLTYWARAAARLSERARVSVLLIDYRGYGKSEGRPSEEGLYLDAEAGFDELVERRGAPRDRVIVYGHSLGTGVAVECALRRPAAGLILEAPFTSIPDVLEASFPFLDAKKVLSERYESIAKVPRIFAPMLIVHGTADRTIPIRMGREIAAAAAGACEMLEVPGAGHIDAPQRAGEIFYEKVDALIERAIAKKSAPRTF